ncbi:MAG: hypothetical protein LBT98_01035 [Puniceicoccales bacterium]|nr:hypothetical protein [Puniceicoccales bacterium]
MARNFALLACCAGLLLASGCRTVPGDGTKSTAIGVERLLREGMSDGEVIAVLGIPNSIGREGDGGELWNYDRVQARGNSPSTGTTLHLVLFGLGRKISHPFRGPRTLAVGVHFDPSMRVKYFTPCPAAPQN